MTKLYNESQKISLLQIRDLQQKADLLPQGAERQSLTAQIKALGIEHGQMNASDQAANATPKGLLAGIKGLFGR